MSLRSNGDLPRDRRASLPARHRGGVRALLELLVLILIGLGVAFATVVIASYFGLSQAYAQEHFHPAADAPIHEQFYSNWMMPDDPDMSCCNKRDCYPTEARYRDGF